MWHLFESHIPKKRWGLEWKWHWRGQTASVFHVFDRLEVRGRPLEPTPKVTMKRSSDLKKVLLLCNFFLFLFFSSFLFFEIIFSLWKIHCTRKYFSRMKKNIIKMIDFHLFSPHLARKVHHSHQSTPSSSNSSPGSAAAAAAAGRKPVGSPRPRQTRRVYDGESHSPSEYWCWRSGVNRVTAGDDEGRVTGETASWMRIFHSPSYFFSSFDPFFVRIRGEPNEIILPNYFVYTRLFSPSENDSITG